MRAGPREATVDPGHAPDRLPDPASARVPARGSWSRPSSAGRPARARPRGDGLDSPGPVLDGERLRAVRRRAADPCRRARRLLDGQDAGDERAVRPVRPRDGVRHGRRAEARPEGLPRGPAGGPGARRAGLQPPRGPREPPGRLALVAIRARCRAGSTRRGRGATSPAGIGTPWSRSAGRTPPPSRAGPGSGSPPRPSGNTPRGGA